MTVARRVVLVRLSAMGDVCQSLGPAQVLRALRPDLELHFVTQTTFAPLLEHLGFDSVLTVDRRGGVRAFRRLRREMRALAADLAIDLQGNWKSAAVTRMSGARRRIGAAGPYRREPASGLLLERIAISGSGHPAQVAGCLLRQVDPAVVARAPSLVAMPGEVDGARALVAGAGVDPDSGFHVLVVGPADDNRTWRMPAMRRQSAATSRQALWLRGPAEVDVPVPDGARVLTQGPGSLRALVGLGALVARNGGRVFGPDTGATHVLAACGAPTVLMSGPQDPNATAPLAAEVLRRTDGPECVPCRSRRCRNPDGPVCMDFSEYEGVSMPRAGSD